MSCASFLPSVLYPPSVGRHINSLNSNESSKGVIVGSVVSSSLTIISASLLLIGIGASITGIGYTYWYIVSDSWSFNWCYQSDGGVCVL
jgi:hypothetical protein